MALLSLPGVIKIVPVMNNGDRNGSVVLAFSHPGRTADYAITDLEQIQTVFDHAWAAVWAQYGDSGSEFHGSNIYDINSATSLSLLTDPWTPVSGVKGQSIGAQASVLVSGSINERYRGGRPRSYLPFIGISVMFSGDTLLSANQLDIANAYGAMTAAMNAGSITVSGTTYTCPTQQIGAILGKPRKGVVTTPHWVPLQATVVQDRIATQRRRLRKVERHR